jgi:hypothetical protein
MRWVTSRRWRRQDWPSQHTRRHPARPSLQKSVSQKLQTAARRSCSRPGHRLQPVNLQNTGRHFPLLPATYRKSPEPDTLCSRNWRPESSRAIRLRVGCHLKPYPYIIVLRALSAVRRSDRTLETIPGIRLLPTLGVQRSKSCEGDQYGYR